MQYLSSEKSIVHNDLAARNMLICKNSQASESEYLCKISGMTLGLLLLNMCSDFGLSIVSDNYQYIYGTKEDKIPFRWSAPEVIKSRKYSTYSDIWSFGMTMWEIYSFATMPFLSVSNSEDLLEKLQNDIRPKQPKNCPDAIYEWMQKCWMKQPSKRPPWNELTKGLEASLEVQKKLQNQVSYD